jgi:4-aminobutyrate aminotransferase-like enzyme/Ser/Thr protein kinase RdoA (MazF antagonist)
MTFVDRKRPVFSESEAHEIAQRLYRTQGLIKELPSERDQNFYLRDASGREFVLKIASSLELEETLDMQNRAMERVAARTHDSLAPRIWRNVQNKEMATVTDSHGFPHCVRMVTFVPGIPLALFRPHSERLLKMIGRSLAEIDTALLGFDHPASRRDLRWDYDRAEWILTHFGRHIEEENRKQIIEKMYLLWKQNVIPTLQNLRKSVLYHDANEYNVLVSQKDFEGEPSVGLIDFGDMLYTYTVAEPAIGAAYAALEKQDPLTAAAHVIGGYHSVLPLTDLEISLLYYFIGMRLCLSVCICAYQQQEEPLNEYLKISERPAWDVLDRWIKIHPRFAEYTFRQACSLLPVRSFPSTMQWLSDHSAALIAHEDARGDYGEVREIVPDSPEASSLVVKTDDGLEWRTIHLGLDYFAEPGTSVYSPYDSIVHSFQNNSGPGDYGPTIILEINTGESNLYILFGHLSEDSLLGLYPGKSFSKGARIGRIGTYEENGNWRPHVHVQLILDMLDHKGTFPGLCAPSKKDLWLHLCPDPNRIYGKQSDAIQRDETTQLKRRRNEHISKALSLSYRRPLHIVRGRAQYLFDQYGHPYLDCVNNVCHVGHSHPKVIEAAENQMRKLNTNTRYLHQNILDYAERLCATLPDPLQVCFLVCSGSEANDLALRLARAYTGNLNTVVLDAAYHGNLTSLIEISPYKFEGPGGSGAPGHVRKALLPDPYRGPYSGSEAASRYAEDVAQKMASFEDPRVTFIAESAAGCAGQIIFPDGYFENAFQHVRKRDGICMVDEVQVGFGRVGTHFWCFQTQNVIPDIVTMGKPIGNGHPMGAVITTHKVAAAFENGMEYFNTFGGNPVSCAIGLAVLDVIREEGLQEQARDVGAYLKSSLESLQRNHEMIGDVRGLGMFLGIELVRDRKAKSPAGQRASYVVERMRDRGILLSTDGPFHNVIKIKPPLVFTRGNADQVVENLDVVLKETLLNL